MIYLQFRFSWSQFETCDDLCSIIMIAPEDLKERRRLNDFHVALGEPIPYPEVEPRLVPGSKYRKAKNWFLKGKSLLRYKKKNGTFSEMAKKSRTFSPIFMKKWKSTPQLTTDWFWWRLILQIQATGSLSHKVKVITFVQVSGCQGYTRLSIMTVTAEWRLDGFFNKTIQITRVILELQFLIRGGVAKNTTSQRIPLFKSLKVKIF